MRSIHPSRLLAICGVFLIGAIVLGIVVAIMNLRERAVAEGERELKNTAHILSEQINQTFQAIELVQNSTIEAVEMLGIASREDFAREMSRRHLKDHLRLKIRGLPYVGSLTIVDADGKVLNYSRVWPAPDANVADQKFFQALKSDPQPRSLISRPVRDPKTGSWMIYLARKITAPNGELLGVSLGTVDLEYFERSFAAVSLGKNASIALFRDDGVLLVRYPQIESAVGRTFNVSRRALGSGDQGFTRYLGKMDGKDRFLAVDRLAQYPLYVSVSLDTAAVFAGAFGAQQALIGIGIFAILMIAAMLYLIYRQFVRRDRLTEQKLALEKQRLDTAVDNMSQGLLLFDSSERLVICNRRYVEMYRLSPDVVKPGLSFRDLIRHRVESGSFRGDVEAYRSALMRDLAHGSARAMLIETADGRSIRIVNRPLLDGGWVSTHEDISEKQRAEEQRERDRAFLQQIIDNVPVMITVKDATSRRYLIANQATEAIWKIRSSEAIGKKPQDLFPPEQADRINAVDNQALLSEKPLLLDVHPNLSKSGGVLMVTSKRIVVRDRDGKPRYLVSVVEDVTDRIRLERERDENREFLNQIIDNIPTSIIVKTARDRRYVLFNRAAEEQYGAPRDLVIGKTPDELWAKENAKLIADQDEQLLNSDGYMFFDEYTHKIAGKGPRLLTSKRILIRDKEGQPQYLIAVIDDVTEHKHSQERIAYLAHYDALTDLPNRVFFREQLGRYLKRIRSGSSLALLHIDVDRFKTINDTLGHRVADEFLKAVAARLRGCLRDVDIIGRLGGDEFAIARPDVLSPKEVTEFVNRIQDAIRAPYEIGERGLVSDVSIGIALAPHDGADADELLKNADLAVYGAKIEGRSTYRFFEADMDARVKAQRSLENDLREAIRQGDFELHYQPILSLITNTVVGCEGLLRWQHASRGSVPPESYIPIAEETGLIVPLGEWVLRTACTEAATWPNDVKVAVNVSPVQFKNENFLQIVINALASSQLPPRRLELEVTEAVLIRDDDSALTVLQHLRGLGVGIVMDDFGTGYSSLSYLQRFPFDKIKIDRSFIKHVMDDEGSLSIVKAVVEIARARSITTTAEGVETEAQAQLLRELGCAQIQGFFYGEPRPAAETRKLLRSSTGETASAA